MSITVKFLEELGVAKEAAEKIFAARGEEIAKTNAEKQKLEDELKKSEEALKESKDSFDGLSAQLNDLKKKSSDGEEWKTKFENLLSENEKKSKLAEEERLSREKRDSIEKRFNDVLGERKFNHEAIKASYLKRFGEALDSGNFTGKSDSDIFHELTKDDNAAFKGVTALKLAGGSPAGSGNAAEAKARAVMGLK